MPPSALRVQRSQRALRLELATPNGVIGSALLRELRAVLSAERGAAVVLTGRGTRFFSPGLDLNEVGDLDRPAMADFMRTFHETSLDLYLYPGATVCALNGHALAGGCILASCCDFRIGARGARIGLTGLNRTLPLPYASQRIIEQLLGYRAAREVVFGGLSFSSSEALALGWLDRVVAPGELAHSAGELARGWSLQSQAAFQAAKRSLKGGLAAELRGRQEEDLEDFLEFWFSEPVRRQVSQIRDRLQRSGS